MIEANSMESFESELFFNGRGISGGMSASKGVGGNTSGGLELLFSNSSQLELLLQLHSAMARFKNYTRLAKSCQLDGDTDSDDMYSMATTYKQYHGYIALIVCVFGAIANCLIMVVLRRKEMHTPVNVMLFALAIADLLIMVEYIPFALHVYMLDHDLENKYTYGSAAFILFHIHFTQILHTISIQLTLTMAIWRYAAIKCSTRSSTLCTFKRCYQVIAAAYICPLFFCVLNYVYFEIAQKTKYVTFGPYPFDEIDGNDEEKLGIFQTVCRFLHMHDCSIKMVELYIVESSTIVKKYPVLHTIHFWTFSVLIKLIPCVVLTFFMCWMVNTLYKARRHHKMLENKSALRMNLVTAPVVNQNGVCQPIFDGIGNTTNANAKGASTLSPSRSVGFAATPTKDKNQEETENPKASLLTLENNHHNEGVLGSALLHPGPLPPYSLTGTNNQGADNSKPLTRSSGEPGVVLSAARRLTKGFIRLSSFRRQSSDKGSKSNSCKRTDRTSKMLIAVLLLFLLTEFPQGIMHFLTGWYGPEFLRCKYNPWAEVWDILALSNSAINFIMYCFMSKQFRTQFRISFKICLCLKRPKCIMLATCNNNRTVSTTV